MNDFSVYVLIEAEADIDEGQLGALGVELAEHGSAVSGSGRRFDVQMAITDIDTIDEAGPLAVNAIIKAAAPAGLPALDRVVAIEVLEWAEFERRLERSPYPELVSAPEIAEMLGVSRQRVHQLLSDNRSFPKPMYRLGAGPLWLADAIRAFERRWTRKPGRPATVQTAHASGTVRTTHASGIDKGRGDKSRSAGPLISGDR